MVKVYGTSVAGAPEERKTTVNVARQLMAVIGVMAIAIVVCVALISSSNLKVDKPVALFGIGSGEEQEGANAVYTAFESFKHYKAEDLEEIIGAKDIYTEKFKDAEKETEKEVEEVENVITEAQNEHEVLKTFAEGADAPLK